MTNPVYDLFIVGGGINGVSVARDAAGRGLSVLLCEMGDLGGATSSASSKLIHGGLRYLEQYAFRLVSEALHEREVLLRTAPHIIWPLRFVLPHVPSLRPAWMIRAGLWFYDRLGGRHTLAASKKVALNGQGYGAGLRPDLHTGFVYSDCWVDDARLVALAAVDAQSRGAVVRPRTQCLSLRRDGAHWHAVLDDGTRQETVVAHAVVNAAGPWVQQVLARVAGSNTPEHVRLVKGSHIVVPRLYDGGHAMILQNDDGRVVFVIPYEHRFSLIGTTDVAVDHGPGPVDISPTETDYLCAAVNRYLSQPVAPTDVIWSYAGVRPLYDDGSGDPSKVTRDYVLALDHADKTLPMLSIFGGKITTARELAEKVLQRLGSYFPAMGDPWTATAPLPGGDMESFDGFVTALRGDYPGLDGDWLAGLARRQGTRARAMLDGVAAVDQLGPEFGGGLYGREVDWLMAEEWAAEPDDVLWRRTKFGLHISADQRAAVGDYMARIRSG
ncbi:MAG: glycerol-3-phosphate dehydrogenase [Alphaproteobacteria bacterium]|nr:glycerol-3-phosphate dehydrogenase [Alphaproteobacteria bacterium]